VSHSATVHDRAFCFVAVVLHGHTNVVEYLILIFLCYTKK
jgi:hypothetical protein